MVEVSLRGLGKRFGDTVVLDGVDARFADGTFVVLVGRSGCGKSTLLRCIAGLEAPSSGSIHFGERDVTRLAPRERDVAMVFQSYALYPHMTVRRNLAFGLELRKEPREVIDRRIAEVATLLEIDHLLERHPRALSGGQRQRVAMGRAIVRRPSLFMFDEPLSNLDASLRNSVRIDIRRLHDELGATSIYVTHDQVEAMTLADVLVVLDKGRVQQIGAPLEIYRRPVNRFVAGFLGSPGMNFLPGRIDGHRVVLGDGIEIPLGEDDARHEHGREVVLGVRPHDLRTRDDGSLRFAAEVIETLGSHVLVHGRIAGQPFVVALEGLDGPRKGERIALEPAVLHLFDRDSGEVVR
jgi:multiple sugar transport system ATP-binding protein